MAVTIYDPGATVGNEMFKIISNHLTPQRTQISFEGDGSAMFTGKINSAGYRIDQLDTITSTSP